MNHARVAKINNELKRLGLKTWFDEERLHGDILDKVTEAIDKLRHCCSLYHTVVY